MVIYFGADHRGFALKESLKKFVHGMGYEVADLGAPSLVPDDDYPDYGKPVALEVSRDPANRRGVLICGSGAGMDIVANRFAGVRSVLAISPDQVYSARHDDAVNVLAIAADFFSEDAAKKLVQIFLSTPFGEDPRLARRLAKIADLGGS